MKKILIISDTHGHTSNFDEIIAREKPINLLIHLGDVEGDEDYIKAAAECETHIVAGNNDFFSYLEREEEFFIGEYRVFITHGHHYYVSLGPERLLEEARARGVNIAMFGHTHKPFLEEYGDVVILNPGSVSYPRQEGRKSSYIVMEMDQQNSTSFQIKYL